MRIENLLFNEIHAKKSFVCVDDFGEWNYFDICSRVRALRSTLINNKIKHLERVAVVCENGASFLVSVIAIVSVGAIAVPIDPQIPYQQAIDMILRVGANLVCLSGRRPEKKYENFQKCCERKELKLLSEKLGDWNILNNNITTKILCSYNENDPALILFSSGTSGEPKGVILTHRAIIENICAIEDYMSPTAEDLFLLTKTMVHTSTLTGEMLISLKCGAKLIARNPVVAPRILLKRIETMKPTIVFLNPTILRLLIRVNNENWQLSSVRLVYTSGAIAEKELLAQAEELFYCAKILNVYGLTEAGPRVTAQRIKDELKYGSVGKPLRGINVIIKNSKGKNCKNNEIGIVYVKTPSLMLGYWDDSISTKKRICDGLLNTGDLGYIDEDGELYIVGRADDMIIRGAHNIQPNIIENRICEVPGIVDCIVFGIPDEINGNRVVCAYNKDCNITLNIKDIMLHCSMILAPYECPQEVYEWENIPITSGGKKSRLLAKELYYKLKREK